MMWAGMESGRGSEKPRWSEAEVERLLMLVDQGMGCEDISAQLSGRSSRSVAAKLFRLQMGEPPCNHRARLSLQQASHRRASRSGERWTDDEVAFVRETLDDAPEDVAECLGRTYYAVSEKRSQIIRARRAETASLANRTR